MAISKVPANESSSHESQQTGGTFDETDLTKFEILHVCETCNLRGATLVAAELTSANLSGVDLSAANLHHANLGGVILCKTLTPWGEDNSGC